MRHWRVWRRTVQVAVLLLFVAPPVLTGWALFGLAKGGEGVASVPADLPFYGSLSASSVGGVSLLDPFAALEIIVATRSIELSWVLGVAIVLDFYTCIGARAFCGWVCPVNLLLEGTDWLRRRLGISVVERAVPRHAKLWVGLALLVASALFARPLFEPWSPISAIVKGILFGSFAGSATLLAIVLAEFFWGHRVWCRSLCPVGALYEVFGRVGLFKVRIDHASCTRCGRCQRVCLADPEILEPAISGEANSIVAGDCMRCGACVDACPEKALRLTPPCRARDAAQDAAQDAARDNRSRNAGARKKESAC
jgi:ferredoxin-type protein NapH